MEDAEIGRKNKTGMMKIGMGSSILLSRLQDHNNRCMAAVNIRNNLGKGEDNRHSIDMFYQHTRAAREALARV